MPTTTATAAQSALTAGQAAARLGVDVNTVRRWVRTEQCPVIRVGRATRIAAEWVQSQIEAQQPPTAVVQPEVTSPTPAVRPQPEPAKRNRRAEPITRREHRDGRITYEFRADVGMRPDGTRDRKRFTFRTAADARKEYRRITTEVAAGTYSRPTAITVDEACTAWLAGRRGIREVTLYGYEMDLKPIRRYLGGRQLQQLTKADGDKLVRWMLTEGRTPVRHYQPDSRNGRVLAFVAAHPGGVSAAAVRDTFPGEDTATTCANLLRAGRVTRPRRAFYVAADNVADNVDQPGGLHPQTIRSALTTFTSVVQSYVDQGVLPRNVIKLVERPSDPDPDQPTGTAAETTAKSWTLAEVSQFREVAADDRLAACWLLSCYGLRRSEVLGLRWSAVDLDTGTLYVRRSRVSVGSATAEGAPKSRRSRRDLPLPADVVAALRALKAVQQQESLALGLGWSDDRLVAVHEDTRPVRPELYTAWFHRLRDEAGLRRIKLHGLRNTSVSLMLDRGHPPHIVAAWHGHDPAVALSIYADVKADELRAVGASLFG